MNKGNAVNFGKIKLNAMEWYVPHYTPSIPQQAIKSKQILSRKPTELQCAERSVFMKEVYTQNIWTFEWGTREVINVPIGLLLVFNGEIDKVHRIYTMILFIDLQ